MDILKKKCEKLMNVKYEIINNFKSCSGNILSIHSLSEYMFYRECFENDPDVVPFQFMTHKHFGNKIDYD
jgi:hypothetical protein